jgi:hypothetical protein
MRRLSTTAAFCRYLLSCTILLVSLLPACSPAPNQASQPNPTELFKSALLTATYAIHAPTATPTISATPSPTDTPAPPTPDPNRTPPALPAVFTAAGLNHNDTPHNYIKDTCQYLKMRWDPNNSVPGTIVLPIMIHSITGGNIISVDQISHTTFEFIMRDLHDQGFETIKAAQLADFLEKNAKIPPRSMILIVDDRKRAENFEINFRPYYSKYGWTVTNAWISIPEPDPLWAEHAQLIKEGWVDYQAHGVVHNVNITNESSDEFIKNELYGSIERIEKFTGKKPVAYIWPGGSFTKHAAEIARQAGYRIGFTINPRGPIMFNWIPQGDTVDEGRPSYIPEGPVGDPLMTLPRYWDTDIRSHIDEVRQIGKDAATQAQQDRATELEYYDIVCKPVLGPIPTQAP